MVGRDAVSLHGPPDADGCGRTRARSHPLARRVPDGRDPRRAPPRQRPGDPREGREPSRAQPGPGPLRRACMAGARHRVDEAAQHQRRAHVALPERPGVVRPVRRVRDLRDGRGEHREPRVRPRPREPPRQRPGVAAGAPRPRRAHGRARQEPSLRHRVVARQRGGRRTQLRGRLPVGEAARPVPPGPLPGQHAAPAGRTPTSTPSSTRRRRRRRAGGRASDHAAHHLRVRRTRWATAAAA